MIARRHLRSLVVSAVAAAVVAACAASVACNAITGTGKYDLVDCPSGNCGDGGSATSSGGPGVDAAPGANDDAAADAAATVAVPDCGPGTAPVILTVTGAAGGSVSAKSGGSLSVSAGSTGAACLVTDTVEMRTSGSTADWTGPSCKDGNNGTDRCEFGVPSKGISITAALR